MFQNVIRTFSFNKFSSLNFILTQVVNKGTTPTLYWPYSCGSFLTSLTVGLQLTNVGCQLAVSVMITRFQRSKSQDAQVGINELTVCKVERRSDASTFIIQKVEKEERGKRGIFTSAPSAQFDERENQPRSFASLFSSSQCKFAVKTFCPP